ncbi:MAG: LamG domain-containing protein, partial [Planctomycetota bacterium]
RRNHEVYDLHYDIRYPGRLRADVSRDKVTEANAGGLKTYNRRVVEWWPKRGVDFTPLDDIKGAPLRAWTPRMPEDSWTGTYVDNFPHVPFEAHLVNFRGVGDASLRDVKDPDSFRCPAPVLRFPDGRKRVILAKYLSVEDRKHLLDIYLADRARIEKTLLQDEYAVPDSAKKFGVGEAGLYKTGKVRFDTKRASIVVPSKAPAGGNSWVRKEKHEQVLATIAYLKDQMENYWAYHEYAGALMRYWEKPKLFKYVPQFGHGGGGGGGGYGGCSLGGPGIEGVFHEWGHGMACGGILSLGGGETAADSLQIMGNPANIHKAEHQIKRPWKNLFHGAYPGGGGYEIIADDPNWGYAIAAITSTLAADRDRTPMHVYAHLGEERGLWRKGEGIRGVGDMLGQVGARLAEFDCQQEFQFRQNFGAANRSYLMAVDRAKGLYRCPPSEAPEPFGVSISRLVPEAGAARITVDFQGDFDPDTYSDWRACIVAVGGDGRCRYSPLWSKGEMSMDVKDGDKRFWLTVTATPKALLGGDDNGTWVTYQGGFAYRYPFQVTLRGCRPGSPYGTLADNSNMALAGPNWIENALYGKDTFIYDLPPRMDAEQADAFAAQLRRNVEFGKASKVKAEEKLESFGPKPTGFQRWFWGRTIRMRGAGAYRAQFLLDDMGGAPHPNGGGWVSALSHADPTSYVGPNCYVLGGAKVMDNAQLLGGAIVIGDGAVVKDNAKLSGKGAAIGLIEVSSFARVYWPEVNRPKPDTDAANIKTVHVTGVPERGSDLSAAGIVANYDCLRPESVLFEDLFRERGTRGFFLGAHTEERQICHDGRLVGAPGFDTAGGAGALVFNGRDQYAELSPDATDFGETMIVLRVKPAGVGRKQTVFDFGADVANRFMLELDAGGGLALSWTVGGRTETLRAEQAARAGEWTELRVEIDGRSAALHIDSKEAARSKTGFRPAHAFPPQLGRRNLVFRNRDDRQPNYMNGQLDFLRIYSQVPENFEELPPVPPISPTKAMPEILSRMEKGFGDRPHAVRAYQELAKTSGLLDRARTWNDRLLLRKYRYEQGGDPATVEETLALRDKYYEMEAELAVRRFRFYREFLDAPEGRQIREERAAIQEELSAAERSLREAITALRKQFDRAKKEGPKTQDTAPQTPAVEAYLEEVAEVKARIAKAAEDEKSLRQKLQKVEAAAKAETEEQRAPMATEIATLRKLIGKREKLLSEQTGPVVKVFGPAIAEAQAIVDALAKKSARSPEEETALRDAKSDVRDLVQRRKDVLQLRRNWRVPPTGLLYRDLELATMRAKLGHLERAAKALVTDRLMADADYIATKVLLIRAQADRRLKLPEPSGESAAAAKKPDFNEAQRELPAWKKRDELRASLRQAPDPKAAFEPYAREKLGDFPVEVEAAGNAWNRKCAENAHEANPDEYRVVGDTSYKRRHFSLSDRVSPAIAERLAGPSAPDDLKQLKTAVDWQKRWYTSTSDWDTEHRQEKDYEDRNHRIKRWLRRIKPYRYGDN